MKKNTALNKYIDELRDSFDEADEINLNALNLLKTLNIASHIQIQEEIYELKKIDKNHPAIKEMTLGLKLNLELDNLLEAEMELMTISPHDMSEDTMVIHGRIADEWGRGIEGMQVFFSNVKGVKAYDKAVISDASGYFAVAFNKQSLEKIKDQEIIFSVTGKDGRSIYKHQEPFKAASGDHKVINTLISREQVYPRK